MRTTKRTRKSGTGNVQAIGPCNSEVIEKLAYQYWLNRGCPTGSAEEDWFQAEQALLAAQPDTGEAEARTNAARQVRQGAAMKAAG
jgi:Protein of unknown function (DUF2934)